MEPPRGGKPSYLVVIWAQGTFHAIRTSAQLAGIPDQRATLADVYYRPIAIEWKQVNVLHAQGGKAHDVSF